MGSAPKAVDIPQDVPTEAASDQQNAGVAELIQRIREYESAPADVAESIEIPAQATRRPRYVRLQSGELIDLSSLRGRKLFDAEKLEEEKAIQKRKDFNQELLGVKSRAKWERDQSKRRINDRITEAQMRGSVGRAAYGAGRGAARVRKELSGLSDIVPGRRNPLVRFGLRHGRGGLAAIAALAGGALIGKGIQTIAERREEEARRQEEINRRARQDLLDMVGRKEYKASVEQSISNNLSRLQMMAPDLYMRAATGRVLPQGAVVIGGVPRQDLLNQLGMAMANGQFGQ